MRMSSGSVDGFTPTRSVVPVLHHVPHQLVVHPEVVVNQAVAHSSHPTPVNVWIPGAKVAWHLLRGLADDFQTANKGPTERWIGNERLERKTGRLADEVLSL